MIVPYSGVGPYYSLSCKATATPKTYPSRLILIPVTTHDISSMDRIVSNVVLNEGTIVDASSAVGV